MSESKYLNLALNEAWKYQGLTYPNPAVGACVVGENGEVLSINAHQKAGEAHAEVLALRDAYTLMSKDDTIAFTCNSQKLHEYLLKHHNNIFKNCSIYVSLEPCSHIGKTPSCASLIASLGLKKVFIAHKDGTQNASGGAEILKSENIFLQLDSKNIKAQELLYPFISWQRDRFITFKWAQRLDGTIDGGSISSLESRTFVHKMRAVNDLLVIGGNTVREDRPTLDARLVDAKAPDILIYSHSDDFDREIALFKVKGRKVYIENSLKRIDEYKNILIEGGEGMYNSCKDIVDYYLVFISTQSGGGTMSLLNKKERFKALHVRELGGDVIMWMKREI